MLKYSECQVKPFYDLLKCFLSFNRFRSMDQNYGIYLYLMTSLKLRVRGVRFQRPLQPGHLGFLVPQFV